MTGSRRTVLDAADRDTLERAHRALDLPLRRYLRAMAGERGDDLASQVWLDVAGSLARFDGDDAAMRRLVFTVARRRLVDHRRRWWQRRVVLSADPPEPVRLEAEPDGGAVAMLRRLPPAQAEVVFLRVLAGLSADEVASLTGRSPGAVRVMQHRALTALAELLAGDTAEEM